MRTDKETGVDLLLFFEESKVKTYYLKKLN
jgi:hypothetical protein